MQKRSTLSINHLLIACCVFISSILTAQTVEVRKNANNEPRIDLVNPNSNTFIGNESGILNTGHQNTFSGYQAGFSNTTGSDNSFFGYNSGYTNSYGNYNSFFGWRSGFSNTTGQNNAFFGLAAGYSNSAGSGNAFFGRAAGYSNTASSNSFFGFNSGYYNTTGAGNSFFGTLSGLTNSAGTDNSFFGFAAGSNNTTGSQNSFFGQNAGVNNTNGNYNSFFGLSSGFNNTTGSYNSFFGLKAGFNNTVADSNSFFGHSAGYNNITGKDNSFFGKYAGYTNTTGSKNTMIGNLANVTTANLTNAIAIGYNAKAGSSNSLILGGTGADAVQVGIGTTTPNASAALDITSTMSGFLPPRMLHSAMNAIINPATGLLVWCLDCGQSGQIVVYNGTYWTNILGVPIDVAIGDDCLGGVVAYILQPGDPGYIAGEIHGLIAAPTDQSIGLQWYNGNNYTITGATAIALGTGPANTWLIVTNQGTYTNYAARLCYNLILNGYSDWFLPSKDELNKLYLNSTAIGGFTHNYYWSSSEIDLNGAWAQHFEIGYQTYSNKMNSHYIRAVRAF